MQVAQYVGQALVVSRYSVKSRQPPKASRNNPAPKQQCGSLFAGQLYDLRVNAAALGCFSRLLSL